MSLLKGITITLAAAFGIAAIPPAYHYTRGNLTSPPLPEGKTTDAIMVFTGTSERIVHGYGIYMNGYSGALMISGHDPLLKKIQPKASKASTSEFFIDHDASSTIENARNGAAWARRNKISSILLITSGNHMPRAYFELRRLLPKNIKLYTESVSDYTSRAAPYDSEISRLACRVYETFTRTSFCYEIRSGIRKLGL